MNAIAAASPNLPYDAGSYTGTIGGTTGTWTFESRLQVRRKRKSLVATCKACSRGRSTWTPPTLSASTA